MSDKLPNDPVMLMSVLNTRLRDRYESLDALCEDISADKAALTAKLAGAGWVYSEERNQFVPDRGSR